MPRSTRPTAEGQSAAVRHQLSASRLPGWRPSIAGVHGTGRERRSSLFSAAKERWQPWLRADERSTEGEEPGRCSPASGWPGKNAYTPEYQELKFTLHRKLLDKINLEALATIDNQRVRDAKSAPARRPLIDEEPTLLSPLEKQQISDEVLDEVFGLGPLEPLLQDPTISDILVTTPQAGLRRARAASST